MVDEWLSDLRAVRGQSRRTIRDDGKTIGSFGDFLTVLRTARQRGASPPNG
jgi:hypothetical protein